MNGVSGSPLSLISEAVHSGPERSRVGRGRRALDGEDRCETVGGEGKGAVLGRIPCRAVRPRRAAASGPAPAGAAIKTAPSGGARRRTPPHGGRGAVKGASASEPPSQARESAERPAPVGRHWGPWCRRRPPSAERAINGRTTVSPCARRWSSPRGDGRGDPHRERSELPSTARERGSSAGEGALATGSASSIDANGSKRQVPATSGSEERSLWSFQSGFTTKPGII